MAKTELKAASEEQNGQQNASDQQNLSQQAPPSPKAPEPDSYIELVNTLSKEVGDDQTKLRRRIAARQVLKETIAEHPVANKYNVLLLFDEGTLLPGDADKIYKALQEMPDKKDILLVLHSPGGRIEPAYLIGKLCRKFAKQKVVVAVPRRAKSAATLISCSADELHLGTISELGPIDPQINDYPVLGLGDSVKHIAKLASEQPGSAKMFAEYLHLAVKPIDLGYYERVAESAVQYAQRLLSKPKRLVGRTPASIAHTLVYTYKDHGFVIDSEEATELFGESMVKLDTDEYQLANAIYESLGTLKQLFGLFDLQFYWCGSPDSDCSWFQKPKRGGASS
jgi:hypothetical protein